MIKESKLIGMTLLDKRYGALNYEIVQTIYCLREFKIIGFCVKNPKSEKWNEFLFFEKVKDITNEGVVISSVEDILNIEDCEDIHELLKSYKKIIGYEIYANNKIFGIVKDVLIQIKSGKILGLIVSEGVFDDLIHGYSFLPIIEEIILEECTILLEESVHMIQQEGGFKKILGIDKLN